MFNIPRLWLYVGVGAIILSFIGAHVFNDRRTELKLKETEVALSQTQDKLHRTEQMLLEATQSRDTYIKQAEAAETERENIRKELESKLKVQPAPADCKEAVQWVKKNKGLLK